MYGIYDYFYQVEMAGVGTDSNDSPSTGSRVDQWIKQQQEDQVDNNFIILLVGVVGEVNELVFIVCLKFLYSLLQYMAPN